MFGQQSAQFQYSYLLIVIAMDWVSLSLSPSLSADAHFSEDIQIILGLQINTLFLAISGYCFIFPLAIYCVQNFHSMQIYFYAKNNALYANHLLYVPKPQHLHQAESNDSRLGTLRCRHLRNLSGLRGWLCIG